MTNARVLLDVADGVAVLTLNRPANGNAIDLEAARELMQVMQTCEKTSDLRVVTLRGNGKHFCSGGDLAAIARAGVDAPAYVRELLSYFHAALLSMANIAVPVVAGIHGAAAGAGLALACATDLAIAARSTRFLMAYSRVGLTPDGSSSWYFPRLIGVRRALELAMTNRELTAGEALAWGVINDVVEDDELETALAKISRHLASSALASLAGAKRLIRESFQNTLEAQLTNEMKTICAALESGDAKEGLSAFLAKREPLFGN